jgi:hypothetical protein
VIVPKKSQVSFDDVAKTTRKTRIDYTHTHTHTGARAHTQLGQIQGLPHREDLEGGW